MQLRATWRSLAERRLKSLLGGVVVALGAVAVVATPAAGGGQAPHLEVTAGWSWFVSTA